MLGFLPWPSKESASASPACPYCSPPTRLLPLPTKGGAAGKECQYRCDDCDTRFERTPSGDLDVLLPSLPTEATPVRRTCTPLEQGRLHFEDAILCRTCQHHQNIIIQLLSAYEPPMGTNGGRGRESEERESEDGEGVRRYREDLERRYPLCATCRTRIQERLKVIEYKVRCRRLSARSKQDKLLRGPSTFAHAVATGPDTGSRFLRLSYLILDILLVQSLFTVLFLLHWMGGGWTLIPAFAQKLVSNSSPSSHILWYTMLASPTILSFCVHFRSLIKCAWSLFLLLLRMALVNLIAANSICPPGPVDAAGYGGVRAPPPFLLLDGACYVLLWLLHYDRRRGLVVQRREHLPQPREGGTTSSRPRPQRDAEDIASSFASLDTALETLGPQTPLTTKYTDLSLAGKAVPLSAKSSLLSSPFFVPSKLQSQSQLHKSASQLRPSSPPASLQPSKFDGVRQNGLESVFAGISIDEGGAPRSRSAAGGKGGAAFLSSPSDSFDQMVLTAGFVLARIAIDRQLALVAVLLVVALGLREPVWHTLSPLLRLLINAVSLGRLLWIVLLFNPHWLLPHLTIGSARLPPLEYVVDMIILLAR